MVIAAGVRVAFGGAGVKRGWRVGVSHDVYPHDLPHGQLSEPLTLVTAACAGIADAATNAIAAQMPIVPTFRVFNASP